MAEMIRARKNAPEFIFESSKSEISHQLIEGFTMIFLTFLVILAWDGPVAYNLATELQPSEQSQKEMKFKYDIKSSWFRVIGGQRAIDLLPELILAVVHHPYEIKLMGYVGQG